jgi:hypothetical protein
MLLGEAQASRPPSEDEHPFPFVAGPHVGRSKSKPFDMHPEAGQPCEYLSKFPSRVS